MEHFSHGSAQFMYSCTQSISCRLLALTRFPFSARLPLFYHFIYLMFPAENSSLFFRFVFVVCVKETTLKKRAAVLITSGRQGRRSRAGGESPQQIKDFRLGNSERETFYEIWPISERRSVERKSISNWDDPCFFSFTFYYVYCSYQTKPLV